MSRVTQMIRSRGYWDVTIRPNDFAAERVSYDDLYRLLGSAAVRFRGWPVPLVDDRLELIRGEDWIGEDIDAGVVSHYEAWRFFTSGQFVHLRAVSADWRKGAEAPRLPSGCRRVIEVWEILFYLTEVFELAARLALRPTGSDSMTIEVGLSGLAERCLVVGEEGRAEFLSPYPAPSEDRLTRSVSLPREEVISEPRSKAVETARYFFTRFGWQPSIQQLSDHQEELTQGR